MPMNLTNPKGDQLFLHHKNFTRVRKTLVVLPFNTANLYPADHKAAKINVDVLIDEEGSNPVWLLATKDESQSVPFAARGALMHFVLDERQIDNA